MKIGTPKERFEGEKRVAMTPQSALALKKLGYDCLIESGAGSAARFSDQAYRDAGVTVVPTAADLWAQADVVAKIRPPEPAEVEMARSGQILLALINPGQDAPLLEALKAKGVAALAMDMVPRISRAQKMDVLSSMANIAGYRAVIEALIPNEDPFFIIAQSYGGMPGMQFVGHPGRRAKGIVFSSSALPFEDPMESALGRRREQLRLNLHLRSVIPDIAERIGRVQAHYEALKLDPSLFHGLFVLLGKDVPGVWEPGVVARLDKILAQSREELLADIEAGQEAPNLLNYILSSVNFSPGFTDRTLAAQSSRAIPFEPWMIDENVMLMQTGQDGTWRQELINRFDAAPPPGTPLPTLETLREAIGKTQVLFTAADNDAFVPADVYEKAVEKFLVPGHTEMRTLPGGHSAIFLEKGYEAFIEWSRDK